MRIFILGFVLGCYFTHQQAALFSWYCYFFAISLIGGLVFLRRFCCHAQHDYLQLIIHVVIGVLIGMVWTNCYAHYVLQHPLPVALEQKRITVSGTISGLPNADQQRTQFVLHVETASIEGKALSDFPDNIQLSWYSQHRFSHQVLSHQAVLPGQRWLLTVKLKRPHGLVNPFKKPSEIHWLENHIQATGYVVPEKGYQLLSDFVYSVGHVVHRFRYLIKERIHRLLADKPYWGIIVALIIGDQSAIAQGTWQIFRQTGISHLVAISGLHITLVAGFLSKLVELGWRYGFGTKLALSLLMPAQKVRCIAALVIAGIYVVVAGLGIPAQRAFFMLLVMTWATLSARSVPVSYVLSIALLIVMMIDPWSLYSAGCWLSFMAVVFLFYSRYITLDTINHKETEEQIHWLRYVRLLWQRLYRFCTTQYVLLLGLLPISVVVFGQYSLISPIANAVAVPIVTLSVVPLLLMGCLLPDVLASWLLYLSHCCLSWLMSLMTMLASCSWSMLYFVIPHPFFTFMAIAGTVILFLPQGYPYRSVGWLGVLPFLFYPTQQPEEGDAWLTALDVGQGMAVLIETAHHRLLYDTGGKLGEESDIGQSVILPYLRARGVNHLDTLLISHQDTDHSGGAKSILSAIPVDVLLSSLPTHHSIIPFAKHSIRCVAGQHWEWDGVQFEVLHPTSVDYEIPMVKPNAISCVLSVVAHHRQILLTGDIGIKQEKAIVRRYSEEHLHSWGIIAPHHGSKTSSSLVFLQTVQPAWAIFQMGYLNQFHHPHPKVMERYQALHIAPYRSDTSGAIEIKLMHDKATITALKQQSPHYWYQ